MSIWLIALLCLAGGAGAAARLVADALLRTVVRSRLPAATIAINLSGSFLLGLLAGAALHYEMAAAYAVLGVGFLGGFTTFSTHAVQTARLAVSGQRRRAALNLSLTLVGGVLLAWLGMLLGSAI